MGNRLPKPDRNKPKHSPNTSTARQLHWSSDDNVVDFAHEAASFNVVDVHCDQVIVNNYFNVQIGRVEQTFVSTDSSGVHIVQNAQPIEWHRARVARQGEDEWGRRANDRQREAFGEAPVPRARVERQDDDDDDEWDPWRHDRRVVPFRGALHRARVTRQAEDDWNRHRGEVSDEAPVPIAARHRARVKQAEDDWNRWIRTENEDDQNRPRGEVLDEAPVPLYGNEQNLPMHNNRRDNGRADDTNGNVANVRSTTDREHSSPPPAAAANSLDEDIEEEIPKKAIKTVSATDGEKAISISNSSHLKPNHNLPSFLPTLKNEATIKTSDAQRVDVFGEATKLSASRNVRQNNKIDMTNQGATTSRSSADIFREINKPGVRSDFQNNKISATNKAAMSRSNADIFGEINKPDSDFQNNKIGATNKAATSRSNADIFGEINKPGVGSDVQNNKIGAIKKTAISRSSADIFGELHKQTQYGALVKGGTVMVNKRNFGSKMQLSLPQEKEEKSSLSDIERSMLEELECPVCLECLQPPIYMCTIGHNLCGGCRQKRSINICPQCRSKMTEQRNFALETIVSKINKPCENKDKGCPIVTRDTDAKNHLENCKYGTTSCPVGNYFHACSWEGMKNELAAHFFNEHKKNFRLKPSKPFTFFNFNLKQNNHIFHLLPHENELFLFHAKVNLFKNVVFFLVQYLGSEYQACKWIYEINIYVPRAYNKCMQLKEGCFSNQLSIDYLCNSGKCGAVPIFVLQNYVNDTNGNLVFKVMLKCL